MNLFKISWANLKNKPLNSFLSALLMTLGIGLISLLLLLNKQLDDQFRRNIKGIDMVVGAKGSPLQLILSSIYQVDSPTGNISLSEAQKVMRNPLVKTAIPLSMGDNYLSYRIVGTNAKYPNHYEAKVKEGRLFATTLEATIGAKVAEVTGLKVGDTFAGAHGFDNMDDVHGDKKYKVVGVFERNNSVIDQLILTDLTSVWSIHEHTETTQGASVNDLFSDGNAPQSDDPSEEITSLLVKFRNPMGMVALPRFINENTKMQAASVAFEINRLFSLLGVGIDTLRAIALIIILIAGVSVFVSLYNSLKERKYEMALMLSMGATRARLFVMLLLEGIMLALAGYAAGVLLSRVGLWLFSRAAESDYHYSFSDFNLLSEELWLLAGALLIGILAAALPSLGIYRINLSRTLAEE
ncbi:MAG: FtsX-like permease family protein [Spirosomaceae bacterium]|jgi:putative ABC transport system permease protein|nr:FtsX-like permease family protein [Spirosomataceae bacterium]